MTENNEVKVDETSATAAPARKVLSLKPVAPLDSSRKTEDVSQTDPVKNVQKSISLNPPPPIKKPEAISSPAQNIQKEKNAAGVAASGVSGVHTADSSAISAKPQQQISAPAVKLSVGIRGAAKKEEPKAAEPEPAKDEKVLDVKSVLNNAVPVKPVMEPASQSVPTVFLVTSAISALLLIGLITLSVLQFIKIFGSAAQ